MKPTKLPTSSLREKDVTNLARPWQHQQHATHQVLLQSGSQNLGFKENILPLHLVTFSFDPLSGTKLMFPDSLYETKDTSLLCLSAFFGVLSDCYRNCLCSNSSCSVWLCPLHANLVIFYCSFHSRGRRVNAIFLFSFSGFFYVFFPNKLLSLMARAPGFWVYLKEHSLIYFLG